MELLQLCQSIADGINDLSFFVTGGGVTEIVRTLGYREFGGVLIALENSKQNSHSRRCMAEARDAFIFAYESLSSNTLCKKFFINFFDTKIVCQRYKKLCESAIFTAVLCKYLGETNYIRMYTLHAVKAFQMYELYCIKDTICTITMPNHSFVINQGVLLPKDLLEDTLDIMKQRKEAFHTLCMSLNL